MNVHCLPCRVLPWVCLLLLKTVIDAADVNAGWAGGTGNWSQAANWIPNVNYPNNGNAGLTYNARVVSGTVTLTEPISIQQYTNAGGTLTGDFPLKINELFTWSGGTISGNAPIEVMSGAALLSGAKTLTGRTLNIAGGTANWTAGNIGSGSGAVISVQPGAGFEAAFDGSLNVTPAGTTTLINEGTFRKSGGTGNSGTVINAIFDNVSGGLVEVSNGILNLNRGGNSSGAFEIQSGATLSFGGGTHALDEVASVTGSGTNRVTTGSVDVAGIYDMPVGNTIVSGGTLLVTGLDPRPGNLFMSGGGSVIFDSGSASVPIRELRLSGGTLGGPDPLVVAEEATWTGGTIAGPGTVRAMSGVTLSGAATKTLSGRRLDLPGGTTSTWLQGTFSSGLGAVLNLEPDAIFQSAFDGNLTVAGGGNSVVTNRGTFRKSAGAGVTGVSPQFINLAPGTVEVLGGTLSLNGGGRGNGEYTVGTGATLRFGGGNHILETASRIQGAGTNAVSGGNVSIGGEYNITGGTFVSGGDTSFLGPVANLGVLSISGNPTVTFSTGAEIAAARVLIAGGTLGGDDPVVVSGSFDWSGGRLEGNGQFNVNAGSAWAGATKTLSARELNLNSGTTVWSVGNINSGGGAVVNNVGVFDIAFNGAFNNTLGGTATFNNTGTIRKSGGVGGATLALVLNNAATGRLEVQVGNLNLGGGGNSSGSFEIGQGATLTFSGGNHNLDAASATSGEGTNAFTSGTVQHAGSYQVSGGTRIAGGTASFSGEVHRVGTLQVSGGTATMASHVPVVASSAAVSAGTLSSGGPLEITGPFTWTGGILAGTGPISGNGPITLNGNVRTLNGDLRLNAVTAWTAGNINSGQGAALTIGESVIFDSTFDSSYLIAGGGSSVITNRGLLRKSGGVGANGTVINAVFYNAPGASVEVASGTLSFNGGGNSSGSFIMAGGTTLQFGGGTHVLDAAVEVTGPGTNRITSGNVTIHGHVNVTGGIIVSGGNAGFAGQVSNGALVNVSGGQAAINTIAPATFSALNLTGGELGGTSDLAVNGPFNWSGGALRGAGTLRANGGAVFSGSGHTLSGRRLNLFGASTWSSGNIAMDSGAVLHVQPDATLVHTANGTIGGLLLTGGITNSGTFRKAGGAGSTVFASRLDNQGTVEIHSGSIDFSAAPFVQTAGVTILDGGGLSVGGGLNLLGGELTGAGTVIGVVTNNAVIKPGATIGTLTFNGDLRQGSTGVVSIDLSGTVAGASYDQIIVTPPATVWLGGTLQVNRVNGFLPNIGDAFRIITYGARTGQFATHAGFDLGVSDRHLQAVYDAAGLTLVTREGALPSDGPTITMQLLPPFTLRLTWQPEYASYHLQSTTNLALPNWLPYGSSGANEVFIVVDVGESQRYFRLAE